MAGNQTFLRGNMLPAQWNANLPDWTENPGSVPESSIFTEAIHDRLLVTYGKPVGVEGNRVPLFAGMGADGNTGDVQAKFRCKNMLLQNCTAIQLEEAILVNAPTMLKARGLLEGENLCGDMISDSMVIQRRMDFHEMYAVAMHVLGGSSPQIVVDLRNFLSQIGDGTGALIGYFTLTDLFNLIKLGIEHFLTKNGYTSVSVALFADPTDSGDICIFWSSSLGIGRLIIDLNTELSNFFSQAFNFFGISSGPTPYTHNGTDGEVLRIFPRGISSRSFQNASPLMTIHSNEVTQFRKFDSISFTEGGSLLGVLNCTNAVPNASLLVAAGLPDAGHQINDNMFRWSLTDGSLISPKINFSRDQLLTEFQVSLWGGAQSFFSAQFVGFNLVEAAQVSLILIFRLW